MFYNILKQLKKEVDTLLNRFRKRWKKRIDYLTGKSRTKKLKFKGFNIKDMRYMLRDSHRLTFLKNKKEKVRIIYTPLENRTIYLDTLKSFDLKKGNTKEAMKFFLKKMKQNKQDSIVLDFQPFDNPIDTAMFLTKFGFERVPGTTQKVMLKNLQKLDIDKLAKSKPNKKEANEILNRFQRSFDNTIDLIDFNI